MTVTDAHGRAHHPAGSPASIGGQYAQQPAPDAAATLGASAPTREQVRHADLARELLQAFATHSHDHITLRAEDFSDPDRYVGLRVGGQKVRAYMHELDALCARTDDGRRDLRVADLRELASTVAPAPLVASELARIAQVTSWGEWPDEKLEQETSHDAVRAWNQLSGSQQEQLQEGASYDPDHDAEEADEACEATEGFVESWIAETGARAPFDLAAPVGDPRALVDEIADICDAQRLGRGVALEDVAAQIERAGYPSPGAERNDGFWSAARISAGHGTDAAALQRIAIKLGSYLDWREYDGIADELGEIAKAQQRRR